MQSNIPSENLGYIRGYTFGYDGLNRLMTATSQDGRYSENYLFDKMGNITNLYRGGLQSNSPGKAFSTIDNLINFNYNGNQLTSVYDNGSSGYFYGNEEFVNNNSNQRAYDGNGNMMYDASNCGIWAIGYNVLNLPNAIQFQLGHQTLYTYSATGAKLKVVDKTAPAGVNLPVSSLDMILANLSVASTTTTDYVGNMIYQNGALQMILLPEGYIQGGIYYYYLKDHLGSNRVVVKSDGSVVESSNFYPSGMRFGESVASGGNVQPYRHIGKEMQSMHGLNWYDNGARMRQVDIPVWTTVDPLAEIDYAISPYAYVHDSFINRTDPTGKYDLPEVTVIGHTPDNSKNNSNNDWEIKNFFQQFSNEAMYLPKYTPTMAPPRTISYSSTKPILNLPNINPPKTDASIETISKAVGAAGLAADNIKLFTVNNAGKEIVYVTVKGANAALDAQKILGIVKGISKATVVVGILIDGVQVVNDPKYLGKATVNSTVAVVAGIIGGVPGLVLGGTYLVIDQMGAFNKEYHPGIGIKEVCPTDAIKVNR